MQSVQSVIPSSLGHEGLTGGPKSRGDTDYTDLTDFTDRSSARRAPFTTSRDEHFVNGTPAEPWRRKHPELLTRNYSGSCGPQPLAPRGAIRSIGKIRKIRIPLLFRPRRKDPDRKVRDKSVAIPVSPRQRRCTTMRQPSGANVFRDFRSGFGHELQDAIRSAHRGCEEAARAALDHELAPGRSRSRDEIAVRRLRA